MRYLLIFFLSLFLTACAASPEHQEQQAAFEKMQKADAKVERKETKLVLTTGAVAAATSNMVKASGELKEAKKERIKAKEEFCAVMGCAFDKPRVPPDKLSYERRDRKERVSLMSDYFQKHSKFGDNYVSPNDDFG